MAAEKPATLQRLLRLAENPLLRGAAALLIACGVLFILHKMSAKVHWHDVKAALAAASPASLGLAVLATATSYVALSLYDVLAVRNLAPGRAPARLAAVAGASGYAVSNLLGSSYLTGTAVRYHFYSTVGLDLGTVVGIIATSWSAFWTAALLILGGLMVFHPQGLSAILPISAGAELVLGLALLAGLAAFLLWLGLGQRVLTVAGTRYALPDLKLALTLMAVAVFDIGGASMTLYAVMPADAVPNITLYLTVFVGAVTLGILSHAPGGIGVFEATMIAGLGLSGRSDVIAALLIYRMIYSALPFVLASLGMAGLWAVQNRQAVERRASLAHGIAKPAVPLIAAAIALIAGVVLLVSGTLPSDPHRVDALHGALLLAFVEVSHLVGSIAGLLLVTVARGLYRRLARAWSVAMGLLAIGLLATLSKGLDWKEAMALALSMAVLALFRDAFHRKAEGSVFRLNPRWLISLAVLLMSVFWIGLFAYKHVEYRNDLWWDFSWDGDASRFLRASLAVAVMALVIAFNAVVMPRGQRRVPGQPIPQQVIDLLAKSPDPEAQIALTGDKLFLLAGDGRAFLTYADTGRTLVTKGDPVGDAGAARDLIWDLRELADRTGRRCAFYSVSAAYLPTYLDLGLQVLKMGEVARVPLAAFTLEGSGKRDFRQAVNKAQRAGLTFEILPKAQLPAAFAALKAVSDAWLTERNGSEKGFSLGACTPDYLAHFDHAVLRDEASGRILAFANLMQGAGRQELSIDLMRHDPAGPKFAMDALFGHILLWASAQGFALFSLGAAPLSGLENRRYASVWNRIGGFVHDHGEPIYRFEGLRAYKQKFNPVWTPEYLACPGGLAVPQVLLEINALISGGVGSLIRRT